MLSAPHCPHVCLSGLDWIPAIVQAHTLKKRGEGDILVCGTCCHHLSRQEVATGKCTQGHCVALNVTKGTVYCLACRKPVPPPLTFKAAQQAVSAARWLMQTGTTAMGSPPNDPAPQVMAKRRRLSAAADTQNGSSDAADGTGARYSAAPEVTLTPLQATDGLPLGLRGLNNLGNTCFMNSVLQALLHAPLVQSYYLGEGHHPASCTHRSSRPCLACEMDALFQTMNSGERQPFSPVGFLYSWWCQADTLAQYQQQDAHEFYLSALSALAPSVLSTRSGAGTSSGDGTAPCEPTPTPSGPPAAPAAAPWQQPSTTNGSCLNGSAGPGASQASQPPAAPSSGGAGTLGSVLAGSECELSGDSLSQLAGSGVNALSMVEAVFGGLLRSDVRCSECGHTSTAYDPFLDISLDLLAEAGASSGLGEDTADGGACARQRRHWAGACGLGSHTAAGGVKRAGGASSFEEGSWAALQVPRAAVNGGRGARCGAQFAAASGAPQEESQAEVEGAGEGVGPTAGRSESCSLGDLPLPRQPAGGAAARLSESSAQGSDASQRGSPDISDVSSLLAGGAAAARRAAGVARVPRPGRGKVVGGGPAKATAGMVGASATPPSRKRARGAVAPTPPPSMQPPSSLPEATQQQQQQGDGATPDPSLTPGPGESQMCDALAGGGNGQLPPGCWESPLDDSMSSPLRPKPATAYALLRAVHAAPATPAGVRAVAEKGREGFTTPPPAPRSGHPAHAPPPEAGGGAGDWRAAAAGSDVMRAGPEAAAGAVATQELAAKRGPAGGRRGGARAGAKAAGGGGGVSQMRCGRCHTCLNRHLKKACLSPPVPDAPPGLRPPTPHGGGVSAAQALGVAEDATGAAGGDGSGGSGPGGSLEVTPEPTVSGCRERGAAVAAEPEGSMLEEPACSHLAMQTVAWPQGQGQYATTHADSRAGGTARAGGPSGPSAELDPGGGSRINGGGQNGRHAATNGTKVWQSQASPLTLAGCLAAFVEEEALPAAAAWVCSRCKRRQRAVKQLSIRRLPPVLCLHVKRFEHAPGSARIVRKAQAALNFPVDHLDMRPFLTATLLQERYAGMAAGAAGERLGEDSADTDMPMLDANDEGGGCDAPPGPGDASYALFAVIVHKGDITGGHYVVYVRCGGAWFCCDDAWVTLVDEQEVRAAQAYMLFYSQARFMAETDGCLAAGGADTPMEME